MTELLHLTPAQMGEMQAHVEACSPLEACGILAGRGSQVELTILITNQLQSRMRYNMDARELVQAMYKMEAEGLEMLATFHSHPEGPAWPSETDVKEYAYPETYMLIWSKIAGTWSVKGFRILDGTSQEIELRVI